MNITPELLKRYNAGQCTPAEIQAVEQWLDDPETSADILSPLPEAMRQESRASVWERLQARQKQPFQVQYRHYLSGIAAVLALVSGLAWYSANVKTGNEARQVVTVQTVRTQKGETRRVTLPDSSVIMLSFDSELRFPSAFTDSVRRVVLIGEAQFSVTKKPNQPFIVETAAAQTRVLGTVFDVKEYPGEGSTVLLVTEGKVRFTNRSSTQSEIVTAGKSGLIEGKQLSVRHVAGPDAQVSWLNNAMHFNDVTLVQVTRELERRYDVTIEIREEALKKQRYTGAFKNPSLNAILGSLSYAVGFRYNVKGEYISLYE